MRLVLYFGDIDDILLHSNDFYKTDHLPNKILYPGMLFTFLPVNVVWPSGEIPAQPSVVADMMSRVISRIKELIQPFGCRVPACVGFQVSFEFHQNERDFKQTEELSCRFIPEHLRFRFLDIRLDQHRVGPHQMDQIVQSDAADADFAIRISGGAVLLFFAVAVNDVVQTRSTSYPGKFHLTSNITYCVLYDPDLFCDVVELNTLGQTPYRFWIRFHGDHTPVEELGDRKRVGANVCTEIYEFKSFVLSHFVEEQLEFPLLVILSIQEPRTDVGVLFRPVRAYGKLVSFERCCYAWKVGDTSGRRCSFKT